MKKVIMVMSILAAVIVTIIPLRKTSDETIQIDGIFKDWADMPKFNYDEHNKVKANLKNIKYYIDKDNLYLYFDKYYSDRKWNLLISITDDLECDSEEIIKDTFRLVEDEDKQSDILDSYRIDNKKERISFVKNKFLLNELEIQIPLEKLSIEKENINVQIFLGDEERIELDEFYSGELILTSGPVFGSTGSMILAVVCLIFVGLVSARYTILKNKICN